MKRIFVMFIMAVLLTLAPAFGKTRLASVYIESLSALQSQCEQAAQLFEAQELGSLPIMMNAMIPGIAHLDREAPIGLHMFMGAGLQFGIVIEPSFATLGSPSFFFGGLGVNGKLNMYGGVQLDNAASLLTKTLTLLASDKYQDYSKASGMNVSVPEERIVNDHKVYRWKM